MNHSTSESDSKNGSRTQGKLRLTESFPPNIDHLELRIRLMRELGQMKPSLNMAEVTSGNGSKKALVTININKADGRAILTVEQAESIKFIDLICAAMFGGALYYLLEGKYWLAALMLLCALIANQGRKIAPFSEKQVSRAIANVKAEIG